MANQPWDISDDSELRTAVRAETQYDTNDISQADLKDLVESAKRDLALEANVTSFYDDRGIEVALAGTVMAKAKGAVENSPVVTKNVGPHDTTFRTSDGESLQFEQYESMVERGLSESDKTDAGTQEIELTRTWLNDGRSA